ncbi:MAG: hypothetical protein QM758_01950 [Armatimonas sp.]
MPRATTTPLWVENAAEPDTHVAFRALFTLPRDTEVEVRLLGASWFTAWLDGEVFAEGPARFPLTHPEYQPHTIRLKAGQHVLAVQAQHWGVTTRLLENPPPFVWAAIVTPDGTELPLRWKATRLDSYSRTRRRINAQLGWSEWVDTRGIPANWHEATFDDSDWPEPIPARVSLGPIKPLSASPAHMERLKLKIAARGKLAENFGYEPDNPQARFFLRDLSPTLVPAQGVWRRYDLGRVRLCRPRLALDVPAGTIIEWAQSESLSHGRVNPWITLSASDSCALTHTVARGGVQEFFPTQPLGGRWLEVHVLAPPESVKFLKEEAMERTYFGPTLGSLQTGDALLDKIWHTGVETLRACAEDAVIDNPTRERGQWAGDVVSVGLDIAGVAFDDLRVFARGLAQCTYSARADGLVSGMCPGKDIYLSTYAAQWVSACLRYLERTGDKALLEQLFPAAERNIGAFEARRTPEGVDSGLAWAFVDWGYVANSGPSDMGLNLHYLTALEDMIRWCQLLNVPDARYKKSAAEVRATIQRYFAREPAWEKRGFHRTALALRSGFFTGTEEKDAISAIKAHILRCFPNDKTAPRLSDPGAANPRLITPYFAHFAFPALIERGELPFVLNQYRKCWGWALTVEDGTWLEVFDPRWSHCHQWAGCPTWQLSEALLGLHPRFDWGKNHFVLTPQKLSGLKRVSGTYPAQGGKIKIQREGARYQLTTDVGITLHKIDGPLTIAPGTRLTL